MTYVKPSGKTLADIIAEFVPFNLSMITGDGRPIVILEFLEVASTESVRFPRPAGVAKTAGTAMYCSTVS